MAYTHPYAPSVPNGSVVLANTLDDVVKEKEAVVFERLVDMTGIDPTADPVVPTKFTSAINLSGKTAYKSIYNAGNSGSAKTLSIATNGPNQKLTLTQNCTLTIDTPPEGSNGQFYFVQDATGGWGVTFPANWNFQADIDPVVVKTANTVTVWSWTSFNGVVLIGTFGTAFSIA